jgi:hypothetical protein
VWWAATAVVLVALAKVAFGPARRSLGVAVTVWDDAVVGWLAGLVGPCSRSCLPQLLEPPQRLVSGRVVSEKLVECDRQRAYAAAGGVVDGVGDRCCRADDADLADAPSVLRQRFV